MALEEGWWLMTSLIGCRPDEIRADMQLVVDFHPAGSDMWLPYARPNGTGRRRASRR
jgi:hypothetical protein